MSLEAQRERIEQYSALFKMQLTAVRVDAGLSAKTLERPGLQAALADLQEGRADGLLVVKLDRLTRNVRDLADLIEDYFAEGKWTLVSVNEKIDTSSAAGRLMLNILGSVSQWEREAIGERTREGMRYLKEQGVRLGAEALGWARDDEIDNDGRKVVREVRSEKRTVARIHELRKEGLSLRSIAEQLSTEGHATKRGGRWQPQTIKIILERTKIKQ